MSWLFGKKPADVDLGTVKVVKTTSDVASKLAQASSAIAVAAGAAGAGPALPIIAAIAVVAAACAKIYAQNQKLAKMFIQTNKIVNKINDLLTKMKAVSEKRNLPLDVSDVVAAAQDLQTTIYRLAGPDTIRQIQQDVQAGQDPAAKPPGFWGRFKRTIGVGQVTNDFREKLVSLTLAFSILQSEFALQMDSPANQDLIVIADNAPVKTPDQVLEDNPTALAGAAEVAATSEPAAGGKRKKTRRRNKVRRTRKNRL